MCIHLEPSGAVTICLSDNSAISALPSPVKVEKTKRSLVAQPVGGKIDCHHFGKLLTCQVSVKCRGDLKLVTGKRIA